MNNTRYLYLSTALILFLAQAIFTFHSFSQIRFEELYESVKAVYFLDHHLVINGLHTNIGWYAILLLVYKIFGFTLHTGQLVRLAMSFISLICFALLFTKYFKNPLGLIPFVTIGLSPTLLYFTGLNLHHAFDLQLLPICLLIIVSIKHSPATLGMTKNYLLTALLFFLMIFAALVYPAFTFYIPALAIYFWIVNREQRALLIVAGVAFVIPVIMVFAYVNNRQILIYDPQNNSGLFRGGGKISLSQDTFQAGLDGIFRDLFIKSGSYDFEVSNVDFSQFYPIIGLIITFYVCLKTFTKSKIARKLILLSLLVLVLDLIIISTTIDYGIPGIKRGTPILGSIYFLYTLAWYFILNNKIQLPISKTVVIIILCFIPLHHFLVYLPNLTNLSNPSPFKINDWFNPNTDPQHSLDQYLDTLKTTNLNLNCQNTYQQNSNCEYSLIYSAIAGSCSWNHLTCHNINGYNEETGENSQLSIFNLQ